MNVVIGHTVKLVAADLREILKICSSKLGPLMGEGASYGGTKAAEKDILGIYTVHTLDVEMLTRVIHTLLDFNIPPNTHTT